MEAKFYRTMRRVRSAVCFKVASQKPRRLERQDANRED